jgi:hypothetical protein
MYYTIPTIGVGFEAKKVKPKKVRPKLKTNTEHWKTTN